MKKPRKMKPVKAWALVKDGEIRDWLREGAHLKSNQEWVEQYGHRGGFRIARVKIVEV